MQLLQLLIPALMLLAAATPASAQDPGKEAKAGPALSADVFKLPPSAYDTQTFNYGPPQMNSGGFSPGRFDLGSSVLQLDTKHPRPDHPVGIETINPTLLGGIRKDDPAVPNYFGMTLSKPLN
jgi:hypothetical protein